MKTILVVLSLLVTGTSYATQDLDRGLACTLAYSSTSALSAATTSNTKWMVAGSRLSGIAVAPDDRGGWTTKPAHTIVVGKNSGGWKVTIFDDKNSTLGSFNFREKEGMKATLQTKAFEAGTDEDPTEYNKFEVACHFVIFAG